MDKIKNQTIVIKFICVLLSFGLWLYITNVENPTRSYDINDVPVEVIHQDSLSKINLTLVKNQKFKVDLKLEGTSSELYKIEVTDFKIVADLSNYVLKEGSNTIPVQILNYPQNITIKNNGYLTIKVNLEKLESKQLKIQSEVNLAYKEGVYEKEQKIAPKNVNISGPKSIIDNIESAVIRGEEKQIDKDIRNSYQIVFLNYDGKEVTNIDSDIDSAYMAITVVNGRSVPIKLNLSGNVPDGYEIVGYKLKEESLVITGDKEKLNQIDSIDTESLDISNINADVDKDVKLKVPEGIEIQSNKTHVLVEVKVKKKINQETKQEQKEVQEKTAAQKNLLCSVKYENLTDTFLMSTASDTVNITLTGNKDELDKITEKDISITVDLSSVTKEGTYTYTPKPTINIPNNSTVSGVEDVSVNIEKK